jgi:hypothetical protein
MNKVKRSLIMIMAITAFVLIMLAAPFPGMAATSNPSSGSTGYEMVVLHMPGVYTSTITPIKFKVPWPYRVVSISAYARALNTVGTGTYTVDVKQGSTSLLSTAIPIPSPEYDTIIDGTLATTPTITDEATVSVLLTLGGTSPEITDVTVLMAVKRQ